MAKTMVCSARAVCEVFLVFLNNFGEVDGKLEFLLTIFLLFCWEIILVIYLLSLSGTLFKLPFFM